MMLRCQETIVRHLMDKGFEWTLGRVYLDRGDRRVWMSEEWVEVSDREWQNMSIIFFADPDLFGKIDRALM